MAAAKIATPHAPVRSVSMVYAPPMLGPRKRSIYLRISANDARHLSFSVDRMYRHARLCKDLRVHHPVPLPRKYKRWTILAGPFIDKKSREQFEIRTHTRLMVIDGDDHNISKYLEFVKNEDIQAGIGVKVQEKAYYGIDDFYEPFDDDEAAIEREVQAEVRSWRKASTAAEALDKEADSAISRYQRQRLMRDLNRDASNEEDPDDEDLGLPENATLRPPQTDLVRISASEIELAALKHSLAIFKSLGLMAQQHMIQVKDREAFMEVQGKMQELSRALRQISMRLQINEREMRKCKITVQDLGTLPPTTPMYRAAGRTFILGSQPSVIKDFENKMGKLNSDSVGLENQGKFYQKQYDETEKQLKELIVSG